MPDFEALIDPKAGWWLLGGGLVIAVLAFAIFRIVTAAIRDRAALAGLMSEQLRRANARLEARVAVRTRALDEANRRLRAEVAERERVEQERTRALAQERAARTEAEAASRAKDDFLAVLSHELRTPLNAIQGWAHILGREPVDPGAVRRAAAVIRRNVGAQERLIESLLDSAHLAAGQVRLVPRRVRFADAIGEAVASLQPVAAEKGVVLRSDTGAARDAVVLGDPQRLVQIVWHLVSNSLKFTPRGGEVGVRLDRPRGRVRLHVTDTGEGIPPEFLPHVFAPFRQADTSSRRRAGGLGLGLALVKSLVELHGGAIEASSPGPGRGTSFTLTLAAADATAADGNAAAADHSPSTADASDGGRLAGCTLLVIDDHADTLDAMRGVLQLEGARVETTRTVREALDRLAPAVGKAPPDAILCDIELPDEDGYVFLEKLRALEARRGAGARPIPVAAVTAYAGQRHRDQALAAGFFAHISKPIDPDRLVDAVQVARRGPARQRGHAGCENPPDRRTRG